MFISPTYSRITDTRTYIHNWPPWYEVETRKRMKGSPRGFIVRLSHYHSAKDRCPCNSPKCLLKVLQCSSLLLTQPHCTSDKHFHWILVPDFIDFSAAQIS